MQNYIEDMEHHPIAGPSSAKDPIEFRHKKVEPMEHKKWVTIFYVENIGLKSISV